MTHPGRGILAGAGVAFVFAAAVNRLAKSRNRYTPEGWIAGLDAMVGSGGAGDTCVTWLLSKEVNRAFARQGLKIMQAGQNVPVYARSQMFQASAISTQSIMQRLFSVLASMPVGGLVTHGLRQSCLQQMIGQKRLR